MAILVLAAFAAARPAAPQGPAGNGAAEAAGNGSSSRSYNPTKWFGKKDNKAATSMPVDELDEKLEPRLRAAQVLAPDASLKDVCNNFMDRLDGIATLRAAYSLGLNFKCVNASMTGVRTDADASSYRLPTDAAKEAETAAREDVKNAAS